MSFDAFQMSFDQKVQGCQRQALEINELKQQITNYIATIESCEQKIRLDEATRRMLHNTIQELKVVTILYFSFIL